MVKVDVFELPPPGAGLVTVTAGVPVEAMLAAGMAAVNCVELTKVVAGADPPKLTIEAATKFVPLIVSVKGAPPGTVQFGEIVVIVGVGLDPPDVGCLIDDGPVPPPHPAGAKGSQYPQLRAFSLALLRFSRGPSVSLPLPHHRPSARCTTALNEEVHIRLADLSRLEKRLAAGFPTWRRLPQSCRARQTFP